MTDRIDVQKLFPPAREHLGNTGIIPTQPIDQAGWIWHPDAPEHEPVFLRFRLPFTATAEPLVLHVSADERYELLLDGQRISRGPDRCDVDHWSYATYRIDLPAGEHVLEAWCWKINWASPLAQVSWRGGFVLKAEGPYDQALTTGTAPWQVVRLAGQRPIDSGNGACFGIGTALEWDGRAYPWEQGDFVPATLARGPVKDNPWGVSTIGWRLVPSTLPDRIDRTLQAGRIVAGGEGVLAPDEPLPQAALDWHGRADWQRVIAGQGPLTVPARTQCYVLWDLDTYCCAYPVLDVSGGRDARIRWGWDEALYEAGSRHKGNRDEVAGKRFVGFTDVFWPDGPRRQFTTHWWRAGRYCLLSVQTAEEPLTLHVLALNETRYPLEMDGTLETPDPAMPAVIDLCVRGMQMCAHETYMDCPYYEQLMYVGDTRLEMLTTYAMTADDRLPRQGIRLFDQSRVNWGFINERYPCREPQHSPTFSMIWALMLRDYAWWRDDAAFVRARMIGLRSMFEHFDPYRNADGVLEGLPGWSFMDWVREWDTGYAPQGRHGVSSLNNLLYVLALQSAGELELMMGEPLLAQRHRERAGQVAQAVVERFWNEPRGLIANELTHETYSEHAQSLALLADAVTGERAQRALAGLLESDDLHRASYYFSFYLFEALRKMGRAELILGQLDRWKAMVAAGCKTPLEAPEPSRSDCHAWSSQPLFHLYATVAGIRPASPGFASVRVEPCLGDWPRIAGTLPHPAGRIAFDIDARAARALLDLPPAVTGTFAWNGTETPLVAGPQEVKLR